MSELKSRIVTPYILVGEGGRFVQLIEHTGSNRAGQNHNITTNSYPTLPPIEGESFVLAVLDGAQLRPIHTFRLGSVVDKVSVDPDTGRTTTKPIRTAEVTILLGDEDRTCIVTCYPNSGRVGFGAYKVRQPKSPKAKAAGNVLAPDMLAMLTQGAPKSAPSGKVVTAKVSTAK